MFIYQFETWRKVANYIGPILTTILIHCVVDRISYAEWLLQEVVQSYPAEIKLHVMYDIACTIYKYMQVRITHTIRIKVYTFCQLPRKVKEVMLYLKG